MVSILAALAIQRDASCAELSELESRLASVTAAHQLVVAQRGPHAVELTLLDERSERIAARVLEGASCRALLEAAAATVLAWEARLPPPTLRPATRRLPRPAIKSPEELQAPPSTAPVLSWRVDLAVAGALIGARLTSGLSACAASGPRGAPWRARFHVVGLLPVETAAAGGRIESTRLGLGLGFTVRLLEQRVQLEAGASAEAGLLLASGSGFEVNTVGARFDPATELTLRASTALTGDIEFFLQAALTVSFLQQSFRVTGVDVIVPLPPATVGLRLGFAFGG